MNTVEQKLPEFLLKLDEESNAKLPSLMEFLQRDRQKTIRLAIANYEHQHRRATKAEYELFMAKEEIAKLKLKVTKYLQAEKELKEAIN